MKKTSLFVALLCLLFSSVAFASSNDKGMVVGEVAQVAGTLVITTPAQEISTQEVSKFEKKIQKLQEKSEKRKAEGKAPKGDKNWIAALLLAWLLGFLGIHRFYLGYTWQGVVQLLTLGGFGIWALIDLIRIIIKDLMPKDGNYI